MDPSLLDMGLLNLEPSDRPPFEIPEVDWQEGFHLKSKSPFFFDAVSRSLTFVRPEKCRKAGRSPNAKLVGMHQRESKLQLDVEHESSLHQVCRIGAFDQAVRFIKENKGNLFAINIKGVTPLEIGAKSFTRKQLEELVEAAHMHTPNLFFLAAKGSIKQFLQAFALADSEAAGHLATMNADGVALIQMLRHCRKSDPKSIALAKLQHYINQNTKVPRLRSKEHLRIHVVDQSLLPPSTVLSVVLKLGDRSLGSFYPVQHESAGTSWLESPLPLCRLPSNTRISFEVHSTDSIQNILLGEGWCPLLHVEHKDHTTLRSSRFSNLAEIDLTVAHNVTVQRDNAVVKLFSTSGNEFPPTVITIRFNYARSPASSTTQYEKKVMEHQMNQSGWIYKKKVGKGVVKKEKSAKKEWTSWQRRWCVVDGTQLKWYKNCPSKREKEKGSMKLGEHVAVERDEESNLERAVHVGNTKKVCLTRCFTVKEQGGKNRRYIYMVDPRERESRQAMAARAKWMEALQLCCQPSLRTEYLTQQMSPASPADASTKTQLVELGKLSVLELLLTSEKRFLWKYRAHPDVKAEPSMLLKFLDSVDWTSAEAVEETKRYLGDWKEVGLAILPLLHGRFADVIVRDFTVARIRRAALSDKQLLLILPQLVQSLKWDTFTHSTLATFLFERALNAPRTVGLSFFWLCQVECSYESPETERFNKYIDLLKLLFETEVREQLESQVQLWGKEGDIAMIGHKIRQLTKKLIPKGAEGDEISKRKSIMLERNLSTRPKSYSDSGVMRRSRALSKKYKAISEYLEDDDLIDDYFDTPSALTTTPTRLSASSAEASPALPDKKEKVRVIFKIGDDLRQDSIVLNMLRAMDQLWLSEKLDLLITPYNCASTWDTGGMIEVVPEARTLGELQGSGVLAKKNYLERYIDKHNPSAGDKNTAINNFVRSCAGYCVATHIMGIGDRHIDNIMVAKNGRLFHIDFGHVLGNSKTFKGIDRERTTFVFLESMSMLMKQADGIRFRIFLDLIARAFNILRRNSTYLISLFMLMTPAKLPELSCVEDVDVLRQRLRLDLNDEQARIFIQKEVRKAAADQMRKLDGFVHKAKHKKGVKPHIQETLKKELSALAPMLPDRVQLPFGITVGRLIVEDCKVLSSATSPLWLVFEKVENDDEASKAASKGKARRGSTIITPKARALQTIKGGPKNWYDHLNAKRGDMATQYERVLSSVKMAIGQVKPTQSDRYVVGDWNLLQDPRGHSGSLDSLGSSASLPPTFEIQPPKLPPKAEEQSSWPDLCVPTPPKVPAKANSTPKSDMYAPTPPKVPAKAASSPPKYVTSTPPQVPAKIGRSKTIRSPQPPRIARSTKPVLRLKGKTRAASMPVMVDRCGSSNYDSSAATSSASMSSPANPAYEQGPASRPGSEKRTPEKRRKSDVPAATRSPAGTRSQSRSARPAKKMTEEVFQREVMRRIWNAHVTARASDQLIGALEHFDIHINENSSQKTVKKALEVFVGKLMPPNN